jgi:hypothetical protein
LTSLIKTFFSAVAKEKSMSDVAAPAEINQPDSRLSRWAGLNSRPIIFWVCFAFVILLYLQLHFWDWPERRDQANWDYIAQVIARGGVPYRDAVNIKTPLSAYIGAAAILIGKPLGLTDVFAIRLCYVLIAALTIAFTYLIAADSFDSF